MPELPEVETVRRGLIPQVVGRTVARVCIVPDCVPLVHGTSPETFSHDLTGRQFEAVERHGKYLLFRMSGGRWWVAHLRMTGNVVLRPRDAPADRYLRAVVGLDDGRELRWSDVRKFGTWRLVADAAEATGHLGPDALDQGRFTVEYLQREAARRRAPVKSLLLDQSVAAGLGNIYADEALYAARIPPWKPARDLSAGEVERLWRGIQTAVARGIEHRGTSFRDFVDVAGLLGGYQHVAWVHRRGGQPCYTCGEAIRTARIGGRSSYWCPRCQPG